MWRVKNAALRGSMGSPAHVLRVYGPQARTRPLAAAWACGSWSLKAQECAEQEPVKKGNLLRVPIPVWEVEKVGPPRHTENLIAKSPTVQ